MSYRFFVVINSRVNLFLRFKNNLKKGPTSAARVVGETFAMPLPRKVHPHRSTGWGAIGPPVIFSHGYN